MRLILWLCFDYDLSADYDSAVNQIVTKTLTDDSCNSALTPTYIWRRIFNRDFDSNYKSDSDSEWGCYSDSDFVMTVTNCNLHSQSVPGCYPESEQTFILIVNIIMILIWTVTLTTALTLTWFCSDFYSNWLRLFLWLWLWLWLILWLTNGYVKFHLQFYVSSSWYTCLQLCRQSLRHFIHKYDPEWDSE